MSYEIVTGLKLKKDVKEVWIKSASNNVRPRTFWWEESRYLSKVFKEEGEESVIKKILHEYWGGNIQPGTENLYYKSVRYFNLNHPDVMWDTVGKVKHLELCTCPLKDLPKYLNTPDTKAQDIIKRRFNGEEVNPDSIKNPTLYTHNELINMLYDSYLKYKKRPKSKHRIRINPFYYVYKGGKRYIQTTQNKNSAKVFSSYADALLFCDKHSGAFGSENFNNYIKED